MIDRTPVSSSNVSSVGYDKNTKTMAVEYSDGTVYHYHDVDPDTHQALISAKSIGKHIHQNIKGQYKYSKQ